MNYRNFSNTRFKVSEIGLGCWSLGGSWSDVTKQNALRIIGKAVDRGVNFLDTADVYGHGISEKIIGNYIKNKKNKKIYAATKIGTKLKPFFPENYNLSYLENYLNNSLKNLKLECIDLLQLHCPPKQIIESFELHNQMEILVKKGKILNYGISVFNIEEANASIKFKGVKSVQLPFNIFRQVPLKSFIKEASKRNIAVIARAPFASGLLTGSINENSIFSASDHRNYNIDGKYFNISETFAGIPLKNSLIAIKKLKAILPRDVSLVDLALSWILQFKEVTTVIPGSSHPFQVSLNYRQKKITNLAKLNNQIKKIYDEHIKEYDEKIS